MRNMLKIHLSCNPINQSWDWAKAEMKSEIPCRPSSLDSATVSNLKYHFYMNTGQDRLWSRIYNNDGKELKGPHGGIFSLGVALRKVLGNATYEDWQVDLFVFYLVISFPR